MMEHPRATAAAVTAGLAALLLAAPDPRAAATRLLDAGSAGDPTGPLVDAVALLAWGLTGWLAVTVVLVLLSRLPGLLGRSVRALARRVAPGAVRRAVEAALGLTVAVGVLAPTTALAAPAATATAAPVMATGADGRWDLDWPSRTRAPSHGLDLTRASASPAGAAPGRTAPAGAPASGGPSSGVGPSPAGPTPAGPTSGSGPSSGVRRSAAPTPDVPPAVPRAAVRPSRATPAPAAVVVRAGDTLWSLAEAAMHSAGTADPTDRQVAQAWPRWWAANREAVGDDPHLLLPGTVLRPPAGT